MNNIYLLNKTIHIQKKIDIGAVDIGAIDRALLTLEQLTLELLTLELFTFEQSTLEQFTFEKTTFKKSTFQMSMSLAPTFTKTCPSTIAFEDPIFLTFVSHDNRCNSLL